MSSAPSLSHLENLPLNGRMEGEGEGQEMDLGSLRRVYSVVLLENRRRRRRTFSSH